MFSKENIWEYVYGSDEELRDVALNNFDFYSRKNKFATFFNVIANHQVSADRIGK